MNPIENESVLNRLLKESRGAIEIIDVKDKLESKLGMECRDGLSEWKLTDTRVENWFESYDQVPDELRKIICQEMFMGDGRFGNELKKSMRFLPHLNNDGGFFVAILKKNDEIPWKISKVESFYPKVAVNTLKNKHFRQLWMSGKQKIFLNEEENKTLDRDIEFFDIEPVGNKCYFYSSENRKSLKAVNSQVKDIMLNNSTYDLSLYHAGTNCFHKESKDASQTKFKIDRKSGIQFVLPLMGEKRTVKVSKTEFIKILNCDKATEYSQIVSDETLKKFRETGTGDVKIQLEDDKFSDLAILAYLGNYKIESGMNEAWKYHIKLLLSNY